MSDNIKVVTRAGAHLCSGAFGGFGMSTAYERMQLVAVPTPKRPIAARNDAQGGVGAWSPPV